MLDHRDRTAPPVPEANLRERVHETLRVDIVSGAIEPGSVFSVPALARTLGVSTTPVREALLQLTADGLLQPLRNRGFQVLDPSLDALRDLFEIRVQLESSAFVKLVRAGPGEAGDLTARADEIARAVETGDVGRYLCADRSFHHELLSRAGNPILTDIVMKLRDKMRLYGIQSAAGRARQDASIDEHYRIVDLVCGRTETDPAALMTGHIMAWEPVFTQSVLSRRLDGGR